MLNLPLNLAKGLLLLRELSVFIDESGDMGKFSQNNEFYIATMVFHQQNNDISAQIKVLDDFLYQNNLTKSAIHCAPLIRREKDYKTTDIFLRQKIFKQIFNFARTVDISYKTITIDKKIIKERCDIIKHISFELENFLVKNLSYFQSFDTVIIL